MSEDKNEYNLWASISDAIRRMSPEDAIATLEDLADRCDAQASAMRTEHDED